MKKGKCRSILENNSGSKKSIALLIDPDDLDQLDLTRLLNNAIENKVEFIFVGGSLITSDKLADLVEYIKSYTNIPCVLFPGNAMHVDLNADAILFLSLISGRNPELLIGQHVLAAPLLKKSDIEVIPTGYMLVNSGKPTSVSYISNSQPIPNDKPSIAASTAMAGEMLGFQVIYMDAGSGADEPISTRVIRAVRKNIECPLIVGGGINSVAKAKTAFDAGADVLVLGNGVQKNLALLNEVSELVHVLNAPLNVN